MNKRQRKKQVKKDWKQLFPKSPTSRKGAWDTQGTLKDYVFRGVQGRGEKYYRGRRKEIIGGQHVTSFTHHPDYANWFAGKKGGIWLGRLKGSENKKDRYHQGTEYRIPTKDVHRVITNRRFIPFQKAWTQPAPFDGEHEVLTRAGYRKWNVIDRSVTRRMAKEVSGQAKRSIKKWRARQAARAKRA